MVFPGAGYVEMALGVIAQLEEELEVSDLGIEAPLVLAEGAGCRLQTVVRGGGCCGVVCL